MAFKSGTSPLMVTGKYKSLRTVPLPNTFNSFFGFLKAERPASGIGLILMIFPPFFLHFSKDVSILG